MTINSDPIPDDFNAAKVALSAGRLPDAITICEQLTALDDVNSEAWELLGVAHAQSGATAEAIEAMRKCVDLTPDAPRPRFNLAKLLASAGDQDAAREELEKCLVLDPGYSRAKEALLQLGGAALSSSLTGAQNSQGIPASFGTGVPAATPLAAQTPPTGASPPAFGPAPDPPDESQANFPPKTVSPMYTPLVVAPATAKAAGKPRKGSKSGASAPSGVRYGLQVQHVLHDEVVYWLKRAIWLGALLTLVSLGSLIGSVSSSRYDAGMSNSQIMLAIAQIIVGGGLVVGSIAVLNLHDWGRRLVQVFGALGFVIAGVTVVTLVNGPNLESGGGAGFGLLGARSLYRTVCWMVGCVYLVIQMNHEYVRLAMHRD